MLPSATAIFTPSRPCSNKSLCEKGVRPPKITGSDPFFANAPGGDCTMIGRTAAELLPLGDVEAPPAPGDALLRLGREDEFARSFVGQA